MVAEPATVQEAQRNGGVGPAEEGHTHALYDGMDRDPQLVDEVVLKRRVHEFKAGGNDDLPPICCLSETTRFAGSPPRINAVLSSRSPSGSWIRRISECS